MDREEIQKNKELIKKYPWLMPRNRFSDEVDEDYDYSYTELDAMPDGWRKAFGEQMCEEIQRELEKFDFVDKFRVVQIKEKFGFLRIYTGGTPIGKLSEVDEVVVVKDWKDQPRGDFKENYWHYKGTNEDGEFVFEHQKILEKCRLNEIISKYEGISERICIKCGKPATRISLGWISPWCDDCGDSSFVNFVPIDEFFKE